MKRIIKISLILLLVGMAVIAAVPFLRKKEQRESMRMNLRTYRRV